MSARLPWLPAAAAAFSSPRRTPRCGPLCFAVVPALCSAAPLTWADLEAAHGADGAAAPAATPAVEGSAAMLSYLKEHGVTAKLNAAVNELAKARPADPMAFLAELLAKK